MLIGLNEVNTAKEFLKHNKKFRDELLAMDDLREAIIKFKEKSGEPLMYCKKVLLELKNE